MEKSQQMQPIWQCSSRAGHLRNKCKQCYFISNQAGDLRRHLKTRSGEKSNKSNQCDYMSSCAYNLRTHLKTHSGEVKQMKPMWICLQADATNLRTHLKTHSGEKLHKCFFFIGQVSMGTHTLSGTQDYGIVQHRRDCMYVHHFRYSPGKVFFTQLWLR